MTVGTVKWVNDAKGFGFIVPEDGGVEVFAHFSAVEMDGFRTLKQGSKVSYDLVKGPGTSAPPTASKRLVRTRGALNASILRRGVRRDTQVVQRPQTPAGVVARLTCGRSSPAQSRSRTPVSHPASGARNRR